QVFFGTDQDAVAVGTVGSVTVSDRRLPLLTLKPEYDRTYYWRVDEVNDQAEVKSWPGPVWSFSTPPYAVVDDFEGYDDRCNRIFYSWSDRYGYSDNPACGIVASGGNGTGATVGYNDAPYAERQMVHTGRQAMPMWYEGLSETTRHFSPAQDWTVGGIRYLVLYFRGDTTNAVGQLYVKINNSQV
ncbi:MAG: hypothetical protein QHH07_12985, partial [Sedimentisphaerales bacterium]|nr:hypothetical protein [Sedimentisphaerales bacterium]